MLIYLVARCNFIDQLGQNILAIMCEVVKNCEVVMYNLIVHVLLTFNYRIYHSYILDMKVGPCMIKHCFASSGAPETKLAPLFYKYVWTY